MTLVKDAPAEFTLGELLEFLDQSEELDGSFRTVKEWAAHYRISRVRMRAYLNRAKSLSVLRVDRQPREALDGSMRRVQTYAFDVDLNSLEK